MIQLEIEIMIIRIWPKTYFFNNRFLGLGFDFLLLLLLFVLEL